MQQVHNYDPITFEYAGSDKAQIDPMETKVQEKEVYMVPANATLEVPHIETPNTANVFKEGKWELVTDLRGTEYFLPNDSEKYIIDSIGTELPAGHLKEINAEITKAQVKEYNKATYKKKRNDALAAIVSVQGDHTFDARPKDHANLLSGIALAEEEWIDVTDEIVTVTETVLQAILDDGRVQAAVIWNEYKEALRAL